MKHLQISIKLKITQAVIPNDNSLKFIIHHSSKPQSIIKENVGNGKQSTFLHLAKKCNKNTESRK